VPALIACLVLGSSPALGQVFGKNKVQYEPLDWSVLETPHLRLHYYAQEESLAAAIIAGPDPEVDGISAYTLDDLCTLAEDRFGVSYGPRGMSLVIKRLGFSRQKARPHHPDKDEAAQAAFKGAR